MPSGGALAAHAQCATLVPTGQVSSGFHGNTSCLLSVFDEINKVCDLKRALVIHWFIGSSGLTRRVDQMTANMAATNVVLDNNKKTRAFPVPFILISTVRHGGVGIMLRE